MKILQYNILDGCQHDPDRLASIGAWLVREEPDVVGLNELNGWDRPGFMEHVASAWGFPHHVLYPTTRSRHFVGMLSRHPIDSISMREEGMHHGYIVVETAGLRFLVTHLTPMASAAREDEARIIASEAQATNGPLLVMGDLNTLSPLDADDHHATRLRDHLLESPLTSRKFIDDRGEINYRPMQTLLDARLTDLCAGSTPKYTVPTTSNVDHAHAAPMRLDYILANDALLAACTPATRILTEPPLPELSDHFPVRCAW